MPERSSTNRDSLTGLSSRRTFEEQLAAAVELAQERGEVVSVVLLDIDHFKRVNDQHGHDTGDLVIRRVAALVGEHLVGNGVAARYGGEEFALLLPGLEREQAFLLAEKIRAAMDEKQKFGAGSGLELLVTVSGGVSAIPSDGRSETDVLRKADQALYRAKETGRNKICIADEERMAAKTSHFTLTQLTRLSRLAKEEGVGEAVLLREALDDLITKYNVSDIES